ncbi:UDP-N-acetylglucosamine 2-epimerase (non-hydrolyzing) [Paenibacillus chitinolyticus]|uniref:non-hydrolyzing UDP-N-acetylglucosamine 2-epimerase n=1 Tax=Paenibacillus chitinolyticus TaxID=79263 RepID=UPI002DB5C188|nr:UDP-N-acetylglucosamine 2-epimerase (non-hydrolyzing) [Paenibacillus chitinolyticus]MEC0247646.1 UDP-N-acetylglucosamine 2-epimerase (non-hydrolyzing) [Paenibacillus chitinolyticus]
MKIVTLLGTRPEIIRLSLIMRKLDELAEKHVVVHTGQNFTYTLSDVFFRELGLRQPDHVLQDRQQSLGAQLATMFGELETILNTERPDRVLLLGDTNSALGAVLAERMGIPVIHMEAGNRCYDLTVPEEKNRRIIDAVSTINMPYTKQSKEHLVREGVPSQRIVRTGNPIYEVLRHYSGQIEQSDVLERLSLTPGGYFAATIHRAENVDHPVHLREIMNGLSGVAERFGKRILCSLHPRTKSRLEAEDSLSIHPLVEFHEPFGFFDFVKLEKNADCVLTDSGTVQEECCIFHVPTVTVRRTTERPETIDCGSNVVSGLDAEQIVSAAGLMTRMPRDWECPEGYLDTDVSAKVVKYVLGGNLHVS